MKKQTEAGALAKADQDGWGLVLQQIADVATDSVLVTDRESKIVYVNKAWERTTGYAAAEVIGQNPSINRSGRTPKELVQEMKDRLDAGQPFSSDKFVNKRKDGEEYEVNMAVYPVKVEGKVEFYVGVSQDIGEQRRLDRLKDDFMNVAAHDLRTPITAIKGFIQMVRRGEFGEAPTGEMGEALADVEDAADRMVSLVNDFLTVSRIQQGRFEVKLEEIDIEPFISQAVEEIQVTSKGRPIEISYEIEDGLGKVRGDQTKLEQALVNLMDNALKHTERGSIRITAKSAQEKGFIQITEANTGEPIPAEDLPRIFEQYYKGDQKEVGTGRGGGLGLGLHIVEMIVNGHGGRIWAESEPGEEVKFHFTLPKA